MSVQSDWSDGLGGRLLRRVEFSEAGCWEWLGAIRKDGYGAITVKNRSFLVHRVAYEEWMGPIPEGLVLDHLCRNRKCFNPAHLEPVTLVENLLRGVRTNQCAKVTHCKRGHPFDEENTLRWRGQRLCRACRAVKYRNWREKNKGL